MPSLAHPVALPLANDPDARWRVYPLFGNPTPTLEAMHCHMSVLSPGHSPHPPHSHREEELIVFVDGEAELIIPPTADPEGARRERAAAGAIVYYPPWQFHTLRNASNRPVTYAVFRWLRAKRRGTTSLPIQVVCVDPVPAQTYPEPFHADLIFEGSTPLLGKLHSHLTTLQPGGGVRAPRRSV